MRKTLGILLIAGSMLTGLRAHSENVLMTTPNGFQVLSISPNGKWAAGVYMPGGESTYGFRMNLDSGKIEMLGEDVSIAYGVANDGTVSGEFNDKSLFGNGAGWPMPGYWRDGEWHSVELPAGCEVTDEGIGRGISPDGHYMTGSVPLDGVYTAFIWKDGKIHRQLPGIPGKSSVGFAVSPDGNSATGFIEKYNRTSCYWDAEGNIRYFEECTDYSYSPWNYGRKFSADGKKLVYWGGLEENTETGETRLYCVYDIENDTVSTIKCSGRTFDLELYAISDAGSVVGYEYGRAVIGTIGEGVQYIEDLLAEKDIEYGDIFYNFCQDYDYIPLTSANDISADGNVMGIIYLTKDYQNATLIVKLDQDLSEVAPVEAHGEQMSGLNTVSLGWSCPVGAVVRGYTVYRDGRKISGLMPIMATNYFDNNLEPGAHSYEIAAVNAQGKETKCEPFTVTVSDGFTKDAPYNLSARRKGIRGAIAEWESPMTSGIHLNYAKPNASKLSSIEFYEGLEVETAVRFSSELLQHYSGSKISEISFRPMGDNLAWMVTFYAVNPATSELEPIAEKELEEILPAGKTYTLKFETPIELPAGDLIAAVTTLVPDEGGRSIATVEGNSTPGYSDLMRSADQFEDEFFSITEASKEQGSYMSVSWAIDLGLTDSNGNVSALSPTSYNVYVDGNPTATESTQFVAKDLADGEHVIAVEALYNDGSVSSRTETKVNITPNYPAARNVTAITGEGESKKVTATWDTPVDEDRTVIAYTDAEVCTNGVMATETTEYEFMAATRYAASKMKGYEGYEMRSIRFYPMTDAEYTVLLLENSEIITGTVVTDYTKNAWNEVTLPETFSVKSGKEYMIAIYVGTPTPDTNALGIDDKPGVAYYSDLFSMTGGQTWQSLWGDATMRGNWMMGLVVADTEAEEVDVEGYNVIIDGHKCNSELVNGNEYEFEFSSFNNRRHSLRVDTRYADTNEEPQSEVTYFYLGNSGIQNAEVKSITLVKGDNCLVAEGEGVESIEVFNMGGMKVAYAYGNKVMINTLDSGAYLVKVNAGANSRTHKIMIAR